MPVKFGGHRQQVEPICPNLHAGSVEENGMHVPPFLHAMCVQYERVATREMESRSIRFEQDFTWTSVNGRVGNALALAHAHVALGRCVQR